MTGIKRCQASTDESVWKPVRPDSGKLRMGRSGCENGEGGLPLDRCLDRGRGCVCVVVVVDPAEWCTLSR